MDDDELDSLRPQDIRYTGDDEEDYGRRRHSGRVVAGLPWQQVAFILVVNAILSLIISLAVVIMAGLRLPLGPAAAPSPGAVAAQEAQPPAAVESEAGQAQPPGPGTPISSSSPAGGTLSAPTPVEPTVYVVQAGDTLGSIASRFGISLDDLLRANGLTDPDYVQVGQELVIPIGGLPAVTPSMTPVPAPTDTPLPFNPPTPLPSGTAPPAEPAATVGPTPTPVPTLTPASPSEIRLVLQVLNPGSLPTEMMQIINQGAFVRLTGWTLADEDGNVYTFPDFSLWGGGAVNVHTASGPNTTTDLYWGQPAAAWNPGELVTLRDGESKVIVTYVVAAP